MFSQPDEMELLNDIIFGGSLKPVSAFQSFRWFFVCFMSQQFCLFLSVFFTVFTTGVVVHIHLLVNLWSCFIFC